MRNYLNKTISSFGSGECRTHLIFAHETNLFASFWNYFVDRTTMTKRVTELPMVTNYTYTVVLSIQMSCLAALPQNLFLVRFLKCCRERGETDTVKDVHACVQSSVHSRSLLFLLASWVVVLRLHGLITKFASRRGGRHHGCA